MGLIFKSVQKRKLLVRAPLLVLMALCFASNSAAQDARFGIKAGPNYSSIVGDLTDGLKFRFSGHAGILLEFDFSYTFALQPEILYSSQGFQFSSDLSEIDGNPTAGGNDFRTNVQFNYLIVPILGKFRLSEKFALEFGPQFGFLLNQVTKIKNLDELDSSNTKSRNTISGNFQLDYGAAVGGSININDQFSVSPRVYLGLRNRLNGLEGAQNYNVAIQLSANYLFL